MFPRVSEAGAEMTDEGQCCGKIIAKGISKVPSLEKFRRGKTRKSEAASQ